MMFTLTSSIKWKHSRFAMHQFTVSNHPQTPAWHVWYLWKRWRLHKTFVGSNRALAAQRVSNDGARGGLGRSSEANTVFNSNQQRESCGLKWQLTVFY